MIAKKFVLSAAAACAALVGLSATAASAQVWGQPYGYGNSGYGYGNYGYGNYGRPGFRNDGGPVASLFQREDRLAGWIRQMSYQRRLDPNESRRAWRMLADARGQTMREAREHGSYLPGHDYREISERLNGIQRYLRHEAREDWDD